MWNMMRVTFGRDVSHVCVWDPPGDEEPLARAGAVDGGVAAGGAGGAGAVEPFGGHALGVAVVVEDGVLGSDAAAGLIEVGRAACGGEEGLQQRVLAVAVNVGG